MGLETKEYIPTDTADFEASEETNEIILNLKPETKEQIAKRRQEKKKKSLDEQAKEKLINEEILRKYKNF